MTLYTIGVYYELGGQTVREIVDPSWRMSFQQADTLAGEYSRRYADAGRRYTAVNADEIATWPASWNSRGPKDREE
jgi:hypothetical protein